MLNQSLECGVNTELEVRWSSAGAHLCSHHLAIRATHRCAHARRAGELLVVILLETVLATPICIDEAENVARECRANTAAWLRIETDSNLFEGHTTDAVCSNLASNGVGLGVVKGREEHSPLPTRPKHSAKLGGARRAQRERRDQRVSCRSLVSSRERHPLGEEAVAQHRRCKHHGTGAVRDGAPNGFVGDG